MISTIMSKTHLPYTFHLPFSVTIHLSIQLVWIKTRVSGGGGVGVSFLLQGLPNVICKHIPSIPPPHNLFKLFCRPWKLPADCIWHRIKTVTPKESADSAKISSAFSSFCLNVQSHNSNRANIISLTEPHSTPITIYVEYHVATRDTFDWSDPL